MSALASSTVTTLPSIIAAIGAVIAASIGAYAILRSQSYEQLLIDFRRIVEDCVRKAVRKALRDELGRGRRWYDDDPPHPD